MGIVRQTTYFVECDNCGQGFGEFDEYEVRQEVIDNAIGYGWERNGESFKCPSCLDEE